MQKSQADAIVPGLLSAAGASRYLGFSPATIYQMIKDGELRSLLYRRRRCIPKTECDRWIRETLAAQNDGDDDGAA
jgi:excisionase family DNA binding protein